MPTRRYWGFLVVVALVLVTARVTVAAPEACDPPSAAAARESAEAAANWLIENQRADGSYSYEIDETGRAIGGYSNVRHAGATLALYQVAVATGSERALAAADRALDWMLDRLARRDGWAALSEGSTTPLGGSALMLAALAERRIATGDDQHDDTMRGLGRFLVAMQRDNGDFFVSFDLTTDEPDRTSISQYYAGEALWALARLQNALPDRSYEQAARRAARFIATERDDRDFVPVGPLNDHWAAYGFAEMADWPIGDAEARYARGLYGRFQVLTRWEAQKEAGAPYSWTHGPTRRSAALGTWVEGQAALARLARTDERVDDLRDETLDSVECGAGVLLARQRGGTDPRTAGAWFDDGRSRMDDQQHAISGLLALAALLETPDARDGDGRGDV